jgi:hypothetical protein
MSMAFLAISACSSNSSDKGMTCHGEIRSLSGQPIGETNALIIDNVNSFSVTMPTMTVDSGILYSSDRTQFLPTAVTAQGFLAQRLSDKKFSLVNAQQDQWITYFCP